MLENIEPLFDIIISELTKVFNGELANDDVAEAKQYSLGRFQRSAQTVGGIMSGYSNRFFFDGVIEDYYQVPDRIKKIDKAGIISVSRAMFEDNIWGLGILGNTNEQMAIDLRNRLKSLWRLSQ
jgi:predicted Zn-dependent peptidase